MISKEEMKAMGIVINEDNTKEYKDSKSFLNEEKYNKMTENKVAYVIKFISILSTFIGIVFGTFSDKMLIYIVASIISGIFIYALGEIIQKLQNIEDNTRKL